MSYLETVPFGLNFLVGRRHGKAVMFVENIGIEKQYSDVVMLQEGDDEDQEDMETDQPKLKKTKL